MPFTSTVTSTLRLLSVASKTFIFKLLPGLKSIRRPLLLFYEKHLSEGGSFCKVGPAGFAVFKTSLETELMTL